MGVNQVYYGDSPLVDLTGDTVTPETLLQGETAHNAAGNPITGTARPGVQSFNGRSGSVLPMAGDYSAEQVNYDSNTTVKQKIDALVTKEASDIAGQQSLVKDTVGWVGKNLIDVSKTVQSKIGATITNLTTSGFTVTGNNVTYGGSKTPLLLESGKRYIASVTLISNDGSGARMAVRDSTDIIKAAAIFNEPGEYEFEFTYQAGYYFSVLATFAPAASGSVTVDNVMIRRADITDSTYEPYHESVEVMYEEEIHGVNLLKNTASNKTDGNVAWVVNANKSITINTSESASSVQTLHIGEVTGLQGDYILNGVKGGSLSTYGIQLYDVTTSTWITQYAVDGDSTINLADKNHTYRFVAYVRQGVSVSNITIYPMLRKANIEDSTYRPYNPQAIQNQLNAQGVLGAKNLLPYPYADKAATNNGVTYTYDEDGVVTLNGTATATSWRTLEQYDFPNLKVGADYILSGCPEGGASDTYFLQLSYDNGTKFYKDTGNGVRFTNTGNLTRIQILVLSGITVNNVTFHPMLRLASDPDDTYQPYAMTNRELTENLFYKNKELTSSDNLDDITKTGLYYIYNSVPTNSPESTNYCTVIVNEIGGIRQQTVIKSTTSAGLIYVRTKSGSPLAWKPWMKFTGTVVS